VWRRGDGGRRPARHAGGHGGHRRGDRRPLRRHGRRPRAPAHEDPGIEGTRARKSALRSQVAAADREALSIYAADKLSKVRELRIRLHAQPRFADQREGRDRLDHYWGSLKKMPDIVPSSNAMTPIAPAASWRTISRMGVVTSEVYPAFRRA
jgi:hypothetical protein